MTKLIRCYLAAMLLIACVSIAVSQQDTPSKKLNLPGADFSKSAGAAPLFAGAQVVCRL